MGRYLLKRLLIGVLTLWVLITITFFMTKAMPGSPLSSKNVTGSTLKIMEKEYGLDKPVLQQYGIYLLNVLKGDLGTSYKKPGTKVSTIIADTFEPTLKLGMVGLAITLVVGIGTGICMARVKSERLKGIWLGGLTFGVSIPNFLVALLLMLIFGVELQWFPILGLDSPANYVLPAIAMALYPISAVSKLTATNYQEVMKQDYITMARAKGISNWTIVFRHVLKNALIPVITYMGPMVALLITGSVVIEDIYTIPGIGREFIQSISNHDYTLVLGITIFIGAIIIICNILADIICSIVDPRIRESM
ncbi:oligopeptide transport system permease protein OppB [Lachnospiraceae bacterium KM106-2]|nr:oligopeptide transport system permease protein OppB [Lachnospiraceae bacterium KM106-2]